MEKTRMKEHLFDKRVVQRALQEGLLKQDDYQRMLDALPDLSDRLQTTSDIDSSHGSRVGHDDHDDHDDDDDFDDEDDIEADDDQQQALTTHTTEKAHEAEDGDVPTPNAFSSEV
jgi:hypothetical protein